MGKIKAFFRNRWVGFTLAALVQGQDLTLAWANTALTAFLLSSAAGVLCGGALADRTRRHGLVAASAFALAAALTTLVALGLLRGWGLVVVLGAIGFGLKRRSRMGA